MIAKALASGLAVALALRGGRAGPAHVPPRPRRAPGRPRSSGGTTPDTSRRRAGKAYGFQLTFFRVRDLHLAHFAWTDVGRGTFVYDEKTHLGLPGHRGRRGVGRLDVSNEDWFGARENGSRAPLSGHAADLGDLVLTLTPSKPPVLHGEAGLSREGPGRERVLALRLDHAPRGGRAR